MSAPSLMRDGPQLYSFDIIELESGETRRAQIACWWSGEESAAERRRMCDCQCGAFFAAYPPPPPGQEPAPPGNTLALHQDKYLKKSPCAHGPATKYRVLRAILPSGKVIPL
jgi:hypothetical protein